MRKLVISFALLLTLGGCAGAPSSLPTEVSRIAPLGAEDLKANLAAADATRDEGRYGEALEIYQQLLIDAPGAVRPQLGVGECLLAVGKAAEAKRIFQGLESNQELHAEALQGEGLAMMALGQNDIAAAALQRATAANPSLWRSLNALGDLADRRHAPAEAADLYAKAAAIKPDSAIVINNIGYSKLLSGDSEHAIESFRRALALDPKSETIENNLRLALAATGNYAEATRSVGRDRLSAVLNNVGFMAMQRGDHTAAEGYFARAMEASGSYASVTAKNIEQLKSEHPVSQ